MSALLTAPDLPETGFRECCLKPAPAFHPAGNVTAFNGFTELAYPIRMDKQSVLIGLNQLKARLIGEVLEAYKSRGASYGDERFEKWRRTVRVFLNAHLPGESARLDERLTKVGFAVIHAESDAQTFWREDGELALAFLDSLIQDVAEDDYAPLETSARHSALGAAGPGARGTDVFIVHGHDGEAKTQTARFVEKLGYRAVILHEQASRGKTIIEKIEAHTDVGFAIVLYTPDDVGNSNERAGTLNARARQNVVFEHGFLMGKLGRARVAALVSGDLELPGDISGVVYISNAGWEVQLAKEMKAAGYEIDANRLL